LSKGVLNCKLLCRRFGAATEAKSVFPPSKLSKVSTAFFWLLMRNFTQFQRFTALYWQQLKRHLLTPVQCSWQEIGAASGGSVLTFSGGASVMQSAAKAKTDLLIVLPLVMSWRDCCPQKQLESAVFTNANEACRCIPLWTALSRHLRSSFRYGYTYQHQRPV
jgi:hypothetical protein